MPMPTIAASLLCAVALAQGPPASPPPARAQAAYAITVVEAGAEPRREFRYNLVPARTETMTMEMTIDQSITMDGAIAQRMTLPTMLMTIDFETREAAEGAAEGALTAAFRFTGFKAVTRPGVPEGFTPMLEAGLQGYTTVSGAIDLLPTGHLSALRLDANPNTPVEVRESLAQTMSALRSAIAPFPDDAIGIGATWNVDMTIPFPLFVMAQRLTYTLEKVEGSVVTLGVSMQQADPGEKQVIQDAAQAWANTVSEITGSGSGRAVIDLGRVVPISTEQTVSNRVVVDSKQGDRTSQTVVESTTTVTTAGRNE